MSARGIRNRNPGNIIVTAWTKRQHGYAGPEPEGKFATFASMADGIDALVALLRLYRTAHGLTTVRAIINRWAPPQENETTAYVLAVSQRVGVDPDAPLQDNGDTLESITRAIVAHENGDAQYKTIPESDWQAAFELAGTRAPISTQEESMPEGEQQEQTVESTSNAAQSAPSLGSVLQVGADIISRLNPIAGIAAQLFPAVAPLFLDRGGMTVPQRNIAVLGEVLNTVQRVTGAASQVEALAKVAADPRLKAAADEALAPLIAVVEAGGGGVAGAREFASRVDGDGSKPIYEKAIFWVSVVFLAPVFMLLADVFYVHPQMYEGNLRTQIVTAVLAVIGVVAPVWFGTTMINRTKDETIKQLTQQR